MTSITVEHLTSKDDISRFIGIAPPFYQHIPAWVRPLDIQLRKRLDRNREPYWQHAIGDLIVARHQGKDVARLLVMFDRLRQQFLGENTATFGLFEAPTNLDVSRAMFSEAALWAKHQGANALIGPTSLSVHEEMGLLVDGFDRPPRVMMPYNREYYPDLLINNGFTPLRDFYAYDWDIQKQSIPENKPAHGNVTVRCFDPHNQAGEVHRFLQVYNDAFTNNWGFVPMTQEEAESAVGDFLHYADITLPQFAEVDGEPAGFILALPDFNEIIAGCGGKLWPFGFLHILLNRRKIRNLRVTTLAVRRVFRPRGIAHQLIKRLWDVSRSAGYQIAEFGYVDANNSVMRNLLMRLGAEKVKTFRIYQKPL